MLPVVLLLIIPLGLIAVFMRDDFSLTLIYLIGGAFALGRWWSHRALSRLDLQREHDSHAFLGAGIDVELKVKNNGLLPILWATIQDNRPVALGGSQPFEQATSIGSRETLRFRYRLEARKRGYYQIGPLNLSTGDIFGLGERLEKDIPSGYITVYPKIIALSNVKIPSRSPQGTMRHHQPLFEDPTRVFGKREYMPGDSLRRVDWKSTAMTGQLQVKLFEPSIALETMIFLNLNADDYPFHGRIDSTELGIVLAASLAAWVVEKRQSAGLKIIGRDPQAIDETPPFMPPGKGKAHLMRMLEALARVEMTHEASLAAVIQRERILMPWGTTLLVITGQVEDDLLRELYQARRNGQNSLLILAGTVPNLNEIKHRAACFGIHTVAIAKEADLDVWRR